MKISGTHNLKDHIDLELTPYLYTPLSKVGVSEVETIGMLGPTQGGKSVFLQAVVADTILQDPGTLIYCFPDEKSAKKAVKDKIIGMIERTSEMREKVVPPERVNLTTRMITLFDMIIQPAWAGSLSSLSSTPAKRVILDEVRLMELTTGDESNAIELLKDRLTTYLGQGGQCFMVSTPSVEKDLLHQQLDKKFTDVYHFMTRCPHCGRYQILDFSKNLVFTGDGDDTKCICQYCKEELDTTNHKKNLNKDAGYALKEFEGCKELPEIKNNTNMFFWFTSMNSPFRSMKRIVQKFLITKDKIHDLKNFIQCWLAQFWKISASTVSKEGLLSRRINLDAGIVPDWCQVITAGGDTQDNGFYITFRAHGCGRRTHLIDRIFIACDINSSSPEYVGRLLRENVENRVFRTLDGICWQVGRWCFDTGGHREEELKLTLKYLQKAQRVKGNNTKMPQQIVPSANIPGLWFAKTFEYLDQSDYDCTKETWTLFNMPDEDEYFTHFMNSEKIVDTTKLGDSVRKWGKLGQNDYRMAEIHNFIQLDLPFQDMTLRRYLANPEWYYNPYESIRAQGEEVSHIQRVQTSTVEQRIDPSYQRAVQQMQEEYEYEYGDGDYSSCL